MSALINKLKDVTMSGHEITFSTLGMHLVLILRYNVLRDKSKINKHITQTLPLSDHFTEEKVVDCIAWMQAKLEKM